MKALFFGLTWARLISSKDEPVAWTWPQRALIVGTSNAPLPWPSLTSTPMSVLQQNNELRFMLSQALGRPCPDLEFLDALQSLCFLTFTLAWSLKISSRFDLCSFSGRPTSGCPDPGSMKWSISRSHHCLASTYSSWTRHASSVINAKHTSWPEPMKAASMPLWEFAAAARCRDSTHTMVRGRCQAKGRIKEGQVALSRRLREPCPDPRSQDLWRLFG